MKYILFLLLIYLFSCKGDNNIKNKYADEIDNLHYVNIKYAEGFRIAQKDNYKIVTLYNLWQKEEELARYYLVPRKLKDSVNLGHQKNIIYTPIRSIAALSNTQIGMLRLLGEEDKIIAVSSGNYIYDTIIYEKYKTHKIISIGNVATTLNVEKLIELSPDIVLITQYAHSLGKEKHLISNGLQVLYINEWLETTPLGRAEWLKLISAFFDKNQEAEYIFNKIEREYLLLKEHAKKSRHKPKVLTGSLYKGTWYIPTRNNYFLQLLQDAQSSYFWDKTDTISMGSRALSFETVYAQQDKASIWLGPNDCKTMNDIRSKNSNYKLLRAYKTGNIYTSSKRTRNRLANDWWETGSVRPDRVLKDLIMIFHPELFPNDSLYFYQKLY